MGRSNRRTVGIALVCAALPLCGFVCVDYFHEILDDAVVGEVVLTEDAPAFAVSGTIETTDLASSDYQYGGMWVETALTNSADESGYLELWVLDAPWDGTAELYPQQRVGEGAIPGAIGGEAGRLETTWYAGDYPTMVDGAAEFHLLLTLNGAATVAGQLTVVGSLCSFMRDPAEAQITVEVQP